ncbi:MAG: 2-amino-4-hydroxy-6-hydroxymethyldihydropteridine diphosphokinase [Coriobacteriales bacterium]|jgi:2-amino-4-hydroxy-6-hydroxymethyldihydropteridine diphosphokinase|nr:2-amino-4-hydroxy-6-hydroxymethyldihydropteridine diphosphokinase [Coriobacteriales bacterium]
MSEQSLDSRLAVIALGSNIGDTKAYVTGAAEAVANLEGVTLVKMSKLYQSEPAHLVDQDIFTNAVMTVRVDNSLSTIDLLHQLQAIEINFHRVRHEHWGPRTLDLDIIDVQGELSDTDELRIPHPYALVRDFVVTPLLEIAPGYVLADGSPVSRDTVQYGAVISVDD